MPPHTLKVKSWKCPHCPKSYTQQSNLCVHEKNKHPALYAKRRAQKALRSYSPSSDNDEHTDQLQTTLLRKQLEQGLIDDQEYIKQHMSTIKKKPVVIPTIQLDKILREKLPYLDDNVRSGKQVPMKLEAFSNTIKFIEDQLEKKEMEWKTITRMVLDARTALDYSELLHTIYDNVIGCIKGTGQISFLTENNTIEIRNLDTELAYKLYERIETAVTIKLGEKTYQILQGKDNATNDLERCNFLDDMQMINKQLTLIQESSKYRSAIKEFCYKLIQEDFDVILKAPELKNETFETVIPHGIRRNSLPTSEENTITITKSGETTPTISEEHTSPVTSPPPVAPPRSPKRQDSVSPVTVKITVAEGGRFFG